MRKSTIALATLLVLQGGFVATRGGASGDGAGAAASADAAGTPLLAGVTAPQVAKILVKDASGSEVTLARAGDGFVVESAASYPAKADAVQRLLDDLLALRSSAVAAKSARSHVGLEVAEGNAQRDVRLQGADGKELARVFLGKSSAGGAFVRRHGEDATHRTAEAITWKVSANASTYYDTQLISFEKTQCVGLTIERAGQAPTVIEKGEGDAWKVAKPVSFEADRAKVETFLSSASRVWFQKPAAAAAAPEHGLEKPALVVESKLKDGKVLRLEVGKKNAAGAHFARKGGEPHVVEIAESVLEAIEKDADFFRPAPPPAPEGTAPGAPTGTATPAPAGAPGAPPK